MAQATKSKYALRHAAPQSAAVWRDDANDWPTPMAPPISNVLPFPDRRARKRRRLRITLCLVLIAILGVGAWYGLVWLPDYRAEIAERIRQAEWALEEARHPYAFRDLIEEGAHEQGLDPALVAAVILNESSFDPKAESRLGARGLMQLMPGTAEWVATKLKTPFDFENMYDPAINIRFGCWFMGYLTRKFGGDPVKVMAGYHAGGGQVEEWLSNPEYAQDGELTTIPFADTDRYVRKVLSAYQVYLRHYYPAPTPESESAGGA